MNYSPAKTREVTKTTEQSVGSLGDRIRKKLGIKGDDKKIANMLLKDLAKELAQPENFEVLEKFLGGDIRDKIEAAQQHREDRQIANTVKANPEILQLVEVVKTNPEILQLAELVKTNPEVLAAYQHIQQMQQNQQS